MKENILQIKATLQIQKPVNDVFEAIVDPRKMSNYFISEGSGRMEKGKIMRKASNGLKKILKDGPIFWHALKHIWSMVLT
jgi:hypothetical protein